MRRQLALRAACAPEALLRRAKVRRSHRLRTTPAPRRRCGRSLLCSAATCRSSAASMTAASRTRYDPWLQLYIGIDNAFVNWVVWCRSGRTRRCSSTRRAAPIAREAKASATAAGPALPLPRTPSTTTTAPAVSTPAGTAQPVLEADEIALGSAQRVAAAAGSRQEVRHCGGQRGIPGRRCCARSKQRSRGKSKPKACAMQFTSHNICALPICRVY
eukprot:COSAG05_NODE_416_length_10031_cov_18.951067_2_plen_216_part_00